MSKIHSYLSKEEHERLLKVCEAERCKPYMIVKMAVLDKIYNYPLKEGGAEQSPAPAATPGETSSNSNNKRVKDVVAKVKEIL